MSESRDLNLVVDGIDELSPAWLSRVLDTDVHSVSAERIGTGQMAATYRLVVDADELPATLVVKLATGDDGTRGRVKQPGAVLLPLLAVSGGRYSAMGGGVPLTHDGQVVAGVGVSGGSTEQDIAIVEAALT